MPILNALWSALGSLGRLGSRAVAAVVFIAIVAPPFDALIKPYVTEAIVAVNAAWGSNWLGEFFEQDRTECIELQMRAWAAAGNSLGNPKRSRWNSRKSVRIHSSSPRAGMCSCWNVSQALRRKSTSHAGSPRAARKASNAS